MRDLTHGLTLSKPSKPALKIGGENKQTKKDWGWVREGWSYLASRRYWGIFSQLPGELWEHLGSADN